MGVEYAVGHNVVLLRRGIIERAVTVYAKIIIPLYRHLLDIENGRRAGGVDSHDGKLSFLFSCRHNRVRTKIKQLRVLRSSFSPLCPTPTRLVVSYDNIAR